MKSFEFRTRRVFPGRLFHVGHLCLGLFILGCADPTPSRAQEGSVPKVGSRIPDCTLIDPKEKKVRLLDLVGDRVLVLFFYPKDGTSGCTRQACGFRDVHAELLEAGARVVGVSSDSAQSHREFAAEYQLPFLLLSDPEGKVRDRFGIEPDLFGLVPGRVTYVIDRKGIVRHIYRSQLQVRRHVKEALETVRQLRSSK
ncbi:MAG: peroxiredoxin [Planctomycetota bacterium]|jgi:peroxiredoxin Q/BCP|nr:peroxiredoxin [Planctomycetota bacterium]